MPTPREIIERDGWTGGMHRDPVSKAVCILTAVDEAADGGEEFREYLIALHQVMGRSPGTRTMSRPEERENWEIAGLVLDHNDRSIGGTAQALAWAEEAERIVESRRSTPETRACAHA